MTSREIEGVRLYVPGDQVLRASERKWDGERFEPESVDAWTASLRPGELALDVGAYTGLYTLLAARAGARCYAFEPNPAAMYRLRANLELNGLTDRVRCFPHAVSAEEGTARLSHDGESLTSATRMRPGDGVRVVTLDSVVGRIETVCAIKVDVEGMEEEVLRGALGTVRGSWPLVLAEVLNPDAEERVRGILDGLGYSYVRKADGRNLVARHRLTDDEDYRSERKKYARVYAEGVYRPEFSVGAGAVPVAWGWAHGLGATSATDWGCGHGRAMRWLRKRMNRVVGVDLIPTTETLDDPDFWQGTIWSPPASLPKTDFAFCVDVLEHLPEPRVGEAIRQIAAHTRRGAWFQVATFVDEKGDEIGERLHLTVRSATWWAERVAEEFELVSVDTNGRHVRLWLRV
ncbi:MAG: class I SAM-dependent methyltransferase [Longimicrobiales bacterium]